MIKFLIHIRTFWVRLLSAFAVTLSNVKVTRILFCKKLFRLIFLNIFYHRAFIFHMLIDLSEDMNPIDFGFTRLIKMRSTLKKGFPLIIFRTVYPRAFIFQMINGLGKGLTPIDFMCFMSKVKFTRVTFVKCGFFSFSLELFISETRPNWFWLH